jgi:hypothetical protein
MARERRIVASFPDLDRAREAMAALERRGVGSDAISLRGSSAHEAAEGPDTSERDLRVASHVGSRAIFGLAVGAAIGGVAALFIAAVIAGGFGRGWVWGVALAGLVAGGAVGFVLGGYSTPAVSEDWELTHEPEPGGSVTVEVRSADPDELDRAAKLLRDGEALSVEGPNLARG